VRDPVTDGEATEGGAVDSGTEPTTTTLDLQAIRADFPALDQQVHGKDLVYLDSAASAQKPRAVMAAMKEVYLRDYANVHRGVHTLSERATRHFEAARDRVRDFLSAGESREIVFVRGTTEAINLVAQSFVRPRLKPGDEILLTELEHHSNIVPWQMIAAATSAKLVIVPIDDRGAVSAEGYAAHLTERTKFTSFAHVSNALGTVLPIEAMIAHAKQAGVPVMIDGAQAAPHIPIDVRALGVDFYAFSSHKLYGPSGTGVLYGRAEHLEAMPPYQGGGEMIRKVTFDETIYNDIPHKFEAGTPNIGGAVGLGAAIDYLGQFDPLALRQHEELLVNTATRRLESIGGVSIFGTAPEKSAVVSFLIDGVHSHDVGTILDREGVAVRAGHHCAQPVMDRFGVTATARASFGCYNTLDDIDRLVAGIELCREVFG